jgi:hypothetical protein
MGLGGVASRVGSSGVASQLSRVAARGGRRVVRGEQLGLPLPHARDGTRRGGARRGAGRKRVGGRGFTLHRARPQHRAWEPVLVTMRAGLGPLRSQFVFPTLKYAIGGANGREPATFRIVHFSIQHDHLHLIVEAASRRALSAGMRGLSIRMARAVNQLLLRRGKFWADRWHGRALRSPREVRNAVVYVLANFRKHARRRLPPGVDPYSSAAGFAGWLEWSPADGNVPYAQRPPPEVMGAQPSHALVSAARTWLLTIGLGRTRRVSIAEAPA